MRAIIEGVEGPRLAMFKGGTRSLVIHLINDDGSPFDVTGGTVDFIIYDTKDRRNAAVKTKSCTLTTAAAGYVTAAFLATDMDFGPGAGTPYYGYVKYTGPSTGFLEYVGNVPAEIYIK